MLILLIAQVTWRRKDDDPVTLGNVFRNRFRLKPRETWSLSSVRPEALFVEKFEERTILSE